MKTLAAVFVVLVAPIALLNVLGGIVSGIWLAVLGKWNPIFVGIAGMFGSTFLLGLAMAPGLIFAVPAAACAERRSFLGAYCFLLLSSAYTFGIITVWCVAVMWFFLQRATESDSLIPLLLWSYGVAIGPLGYMASKERENVASTFTVFFAALAYIVAGLWTLFGVPNVKDVLLLFASIMGLGMIALFANAAVVLHQEKGA